MSMRMTKWETNARQGIGLGIGLMLAIILVNVGLIWLAVDRASVDGTVDIGTFVIGLVVLISLMLLAFIGYGIYGLARSWYLLDRNALIIRWGSTEETIPSGQIERVLTGEEVEGRIRFFGGRWPGHCVGVGVVPGQGPASFYSTISPRYQIYVVTPSRVYGISPANRDEFLASLRQRWEMGPTQALEPSSKKPAIATLSVWQDRAGMILLAISLLPALVLTGLLTVRFDSLSASIPIHFDAVGNVDHFVPRGQIFIIPLIGFVTSLLNGFLGIAIHRRERAASLLLWGGAILVQVLIWIAAAGIMAQS